MTVSGSGFGTQQGQLKIGSGGTNATITSWSDSQIVATVAPGTSGPGLLYVALNGVNSNMLPMVMSPATITTVTPNTNISAGTQITISGAGFGTTQGIVYIGSQATHATIVSWTDTQVVITVAAGTLPGSIWLSRNGVTSNSLPIAMASPTINAVNPVNGPVGTQVTITGSGFGAAQGTGGIVFINTAATVVSWSDTQIVATVAAGAQSGSVAVKQNTQYSNSVQFAVSTLNISGISPTNGTTGTQVTISGTGFGSSQSTSKVWIGTAYATVVSWSNAQIIASVASGTGSGPVEVCVSGYWSNSVGFTVNPSISGVSPGSGPVGSSVTVSGANFGTTQGSSTIVFNGTPATTTLSWSDTSVSVPVPTGATSGNVVVTVNGVASNGTNFTVLPTPNITGLSPAANATGALVVVSGTNFGTSQGASTVTFNGVAANTFTAWSQSSISAQVPSGATTGNVIVTVSGVASNGAEFTVLPADFVGTGAMASARYGHTATRLTNGGVLITGGRNPAGILAGAEMYSASNQTFTSAATMSTTRWLHTATLLNDGTVLIAGGSSQTSETALNTAEIYDPVAGTYTTLYSTLNTARVGHTATLLSNGQVLIVGGFDPANGIISDAELYDPTAQIFIDLGSTNNPRFHHTATMLQNGQVLIAGGETDSAPTGAYNTAEIFDPTTWVFTPLSANMTSVREGHAAVLLNSGQVLIAGGEIPGAGSAQTAEVYNPSTNTFTAVSAGMTTARTLHSATLLNGGKVLITGGVTDSSGTSRVLSNAEIFDPANQTFAAVPTTMTSVRELQTVTLLNDGTLLEVGGTDGTNALNTAEVYVTSKLVGLTSVAVAPSDPSVPLGSQQLFVATGTFSNGSTQVLSSALWSSSSPGVFTATNDASDSGFVASTGLGNATVTASATGISGSATVVVPAPTLVSIAVGSQSLNMPLGTSQQFTATGTYSDGSFQDLTSVATWTSSSDVATVNNAGLGTAAAVGSAIVQAGYGSQTGSATVTVGVPALVSLAVSPSAAIVPLGLAQQYQVTGTYTDGSTQSLTNSVNWYVVPQTSASVNSSGLVTATAQGMVDVTAVYAALSGVSTLTVALPNLISIAVAPNPSNVPVGSNQQFIAVGRYSDGSTQDISSMATWASSNSTISTINASGLATMLAGGTTIITASFGSIAGSATLMVHAGTIALNTSRYQHSATLLDDGSVLIAGGITCPSAGSCTYLNSAEAYNPSSGTIASTGSMATARIAPSVLLGNGKVLVAGGYNCDSSGNCASLNSAEIYDPVAGTFSSAGNMTAARYGHTMTLLSNGQVLIAGGETCSSSTSCTVLNSAELYNPIAGTFSATGNLQTARFNASAVALTSGLVTVIGGFGGSNLLASAELYDPAGGTFILHGGLHVARASATATLLDNGIVIVAGGSTCNLPGCPTVSTELDNADDGYFYYPTYPTGNMNVARFDQTATLLTNGQVLFAGGYDSCAPSCVSDGTTEFFDPMASTFTTSQALSTGRSGHTATLLTDGSVLLAGGINNGVTLASTDLYQPASLELPQLASITVSTANPVPVGATASLSATGYDSSGNAMGTLQSVVWSSSSPSVATVSNATGSSGIVNALTSGTTTITATVGSVIASTTVTVTTPLVSIAVTPTSPTISLGSSQLFNLTATGTYADGSTMDLSSDVNWTSSNTSVATVFDISGNPAVVVPASPGNTIITATFGSVTGSTTVTVNMPLAPAPPMVTGVSPTSGAAGTQVTITGSGFGPTQGSGAVWLGTALGVIVSWSDTQVIATVSTGSSSGVAQILQSNGASNSTPFTINTATITEVSPNNGLAGTQVTIAGSGFGATQGNGNVWLGTVPAIVNSWSDGQIVATVAAGAGTGTTLVLQNGVMSNPMPFTINLPHITGISPNTASAGTVVTVTGGGFGATQGSGNVWIGNTYGVVVGWSDAQVVASVASNAVSGVVKIEQNATWSNAVTFTVPGSFGGGGPVTLVPNQMNMVVGGTQAMQAVSSGGQSINGLTWTSSNTAVATLSTDDPPIVTAIAPGNATISAGNASADVTVVTGTVLPIGTVIWSNPGDGSGVSKIVPAVPSSTGAADVFALNGDCNIQAIKTDGTAAWTVNIGTNPASGGCNSYVPDFQGGLVVYNPQSIYKLDGMTGEAYPAYTAASDHNISAPLVHTDGTIFTIDSYSTSSQTSTIGYSSASSTSHSSVVGIDPLSGQPKFSAQMGDSTSTSTSIGFWDSIQCGDSPLPLSQERASAPSMSSSTAPTWGIIAGDGYLYAFDGPVKTTEKTVLVEYARYDCNWVTSGMQQQHLGLLRIGTGGDAYEIGLTDAAETWNGNAYAGSLISPGSLITNADQGTLATYEIDTCSGNCSGSNRTQSFYLATTSGASLASNTQVAIVPEQTSSVVPVLQRADGSYVGTVSSTVGSLMVAFTGAGSTLWTLPNDTPQIATKGGGVIGASGTTYDQNGSTTGQIANMPIQSWLGNAYQIGSTEQESFEPIPEDLSFWSESGGNPSIVNPVAVKLQHARVFIPYGLYKPAGEDCEVSEDGTLSCTSFLPPVIDGQDSQFRNQALSAVPAWKSVMDIRIPASNSATLSNYLTFAAATGPVHYPATDEIVAYIGHGIGQPNDPQDGFYDSTSMGLVFPDSQCLWFDNLKPPVVWPHLPGIFPCHNDVEISVTQKPRIIFLGMCGFTSTMLSDWAVNTNRQVFIYPLYDASDTVNELQLGLAGHEFMTFLQYLSQGDTTVAQALSKMNDQTQHDISYGHQHKTLAPSWGWKWKSYGNTNLTFTAP